MAAILMVALLALAAFPLIERVFASRADQAGDTTLRIAVEGLRGTLERFEPLPKLIAERPILIELLKDPTNEGLLPFVNEQMRLTAMTLGVSDVYLMDIGGLTIAASSYRKELSFVGRNFGYRPYFTQAVDGGLGRYFAMGTTSGERGYFFAAPVLDNTRVLGVIAIKFVVDPFEASWRGGPSDIIVSDQAGVIFMSSRTDWHFRTLAPLSSADFTRIAEDRQYPLENLTPLEVTRSEQNGYVRLTIDGESFLANETRMPLAGWKVTHLTPYATVRAPVILTLTVVGLLVILATIGVQALVERRARTRERFEIERLAKTHLEEQVALRTEALNAANEQLRSEIDERRAAEKRLRKMQRELVQAGKLAALGQMSAALSHEINQPLTAVKAYADNAATFLERNRIDDAVANVSRISKMVDRIASISEHLRNFARRPQDHVESVDLAEIVSDATDLMDVRLKAAEAKVTVQGLEPPIWVRGGRVRLQQVIVNLLSNALDAMSRLPEPEILIDITRTPEGRTVVSVSDIGAGLSEEVLEQVFDPFFTTKSPNGGLGLGLSISYNIVKDFGGDLTARNRPEGGAVFMVSLVSAEAPAPTGVAAQ